jgi:hypothetical protein
MIRISVKGLAKYMTSSPAAQRRILREYKYPDEDEPSAMRRYYKEVTDRIRAYHSSPHDRAWLQRKTSELAELARVTPGRGAARLRHNARALAAYERHFATKAYVPQAQLRLQLPVGNVLVSVAPDLHTFERNRVKLIKLDFSTTLPNVEAVKIVSQVMFEAARGRVSDLKSSSISYLDVTRGSEHKGARAGGRALREIEAACLSIESIWPGI